MRSILRRIVDRLTAAIRRQDWRRPENGPKPWKSDGEDDKDDRVDEWLAVIERQITDAERNARRAGLS